MEENTILVSNISPQATETTLKEFFSFCGNITNISLDIRDDGSPTEAMLTFDTQEAVDTALLLNGALLDERPLGVCLLKDLDKVNPPVPQPTRDPQPQQQPQEHHSLFASKLAPVLAATYCFGSGIFNKMKELDEKAKISVTVNTATEATLQTLKNVDDQWKISSTVENVTKQVDNSLNISANVSTAYNKVSTTVDNIKATPQAQTIATNFANLTHMIEPQTNAIRNEFEEVKTQTREIIEKTETPPTQTQTQTPQ
jgi:RNA recognition motif-containing protein